MIFKVLGYSDLTDDTDLMNTTLWWHPKFKSSESSRQFFSVFRCVKRQLPFITFQSSHS